MNLVADCKFLPAALTSLQPQKLTVNLTYNIAGMMETVPVCTQQAPGSDCLAKPHAIRSAFSQLSFIRSPLPHIPCG